ncbi:MAG: nucleotidyltransferase domain-containing protein [Lachnospiraceae bacterium]|nr:nucleotidyltransferase domain-containing protein [Lachnospiraceae bacterium]
MSNAIRSILYGFSIQLKRLLGKDLSKIILYGSYARGDFQENSDVDVMILVKLSPEQIEHFESSVFDLAFDIELEHGIHISPIIKNEDQFEYWADVLPFYRTVRKEGVEING